MLLPCRAPRPSAGRTWSASIYHRLVRDSFDRIIRADRPVATTFTLIGVGFIVSLLAGLVVGLIADDFRAAFGSTVTVGMIVTAVVSIGLLAVATVRQ